MDDNPSQDLFVSSLAVKKQVLTWCKLHFASENGLNQVAFIVSLQQLQEKEQIWFIVGFGPNIDIIFGSDIRLRSCT